MTLTLSSVQDALHRVRPHVHLTPVLTCQALNQLAGRELYFKCENFQKIGAFKARGAANAVLKLTEDQAKNGVVTHSSGNHAQALSWAAKLRGIKAYIVMPHDAPKAKVAGVLANGAEITFCESTLKGRTDACEKIMKETGATFVPPYDDYDVMGGQGTLALEFLEQIPQLDCIIAPISGGGLLSGVAVAAKGTKPNISVFGAEPKGASDAHESLKAGTLVGPPFNPPVTICDGLKTGVVGKKPWPIIKDNVEYIFTAYDYQTRAAMLLLWERMKMIVEPSGAVALACILSDEFKSYASTKNIQKVGIVISGGNLDITTWDWNAKLPDAHLLPQQNSS